MRYIYNNTNRIKALACAVILRAINDAQGIGVKCGSRHDANTKLTLQSARDFLSESEGLKIWCSIAEVPYSKVISVNKKWRLA
jgi:hypothetical protein